MAGTEKVDEFAIEQVREAIKPSPAGDAADVEFADRMGTIVYDPHGGKKVEHLQLWGCENCGVVMLKKPQAGTCFICCHPIKEITLRQCVCGLIAMERK